MTDINSHGHEMHPIVLIKFFHCALKSNFIKKPSGVFHAPVGIWQVGEKFKP